MVESDSIFDRRRYTAVAFTHPGLTKASDVRAPLGPSATFDKSKSFGGGWTGLKVEYVDPANRYRSFRINPSDVARDSGYAYRVLVLSRTFVDGNRSLPLTIVAAPFVSLLQRLVRRVADSVGQPKIRYIAFDMDRLFTHLTQERAPFRATQITLQPEGLVGLSLVSLTGPSPLISELRRDLRHKALPYRARLEMISDPSRIRLYLDRRGELHWHHNGDADIRTVAESVAHMFEHRLTRWTHRDPLLPESTKAQAAEDGGE